MRGGDRHDMTEPFQRNSVSIAQIGTDRAGKTHRLVHRVPPRTSNGCDLSHPFKVIDTRPILILEVINAPTARITPGPH